MSTATPPAPTNNVKPAAAPKGQPAPVIVFRQNLDQKLFTPERLKQLTPPLVASGLFHIVVFVLLFLLLARSVNSAPPEQVVYESNVEETEKKVNLTEEDIGLDPDVPLNYDKPRIEEVSVPGPVDPAAPVGILNAETAPPMNISPPPGVGGSDGQGGGVDSDQAGHASMVGFAGGMGGGPLTGAFGGRSGATRERMAIEGGGNTKSEAAVARGLKWMSLHQSADGHWSLDAFNQAGRCSCGGFGAKHDVGGCAFGVLPFLGAGETHKKGVYSKVVDKAMTYLVTKQAADGSFSHFMYEHGLATIAMCEAYALTSDNRLKGPAQKALNFIEEAQSEAGGWRYGPKEAGFDTSVCGWQLMALKSGQMGGLAVKKKTLEKATDWLNAAMDPTTGGYGYTSAANAGPAMAAVGNLCREYLGWGPNNPNLTKGVQWLSQPANAPGALKNMYYYYYGTQVMHHYGRDPWKKWNEKMRDTLVNSQDQGDDKAKAHQRGSWNPAGDQWGPAGGRVMITSLSLLTLEVYYRHLPLYRRDANADAKAEK